MSDKIIHLNEGAIKQELKELVRNSVEKHSTIYWNKKQRSYQMPVDMSVQKNVKAIDLGIMSEI